MNQNNVIIAGREMVSLTADAGHILHRIGSDEYTVIDKMTVTLEDVVNIEEVAVEDAPTDEDPDYQARVTELVRERYDARSEADILRRTLAVMLHPPVMTLDETDDTPGEDPAAKVLAEFDEYNDYVSWCSENAKQQNSNNLMTI